MALWINFSHDLFVASRMKKHPCSSTLSSYKSILVLCLESNNLSSFDKISYDSSIPTSTYDRYQTNTHCHDLSNFDQSLSRR